MLPLERSGQKVPLSFVEMMQMRFLWVQSATQVHDFLMVILRAAQLSLECGVAWICTQTFVQFVSMKGFRTKSMDDSQTSGTLIWSTWLFFVKTQRASIILFYTEVLSVRKDWKVMNLQKSNFLACTVKSLTIRGQYPPTARSDSSRWVLRFAILGMGPPSTVFLEFHALTKAMSHVAVSFSAEPLMRLRLLMRMWKKTTVTSMHLPSG